MKKITEDWFISAESDLLLIKEIKDQEHLSLLSAFHSQQAIEKSLKAVIEEFELGFKKTHSLETLFDITKIRFIYDLEESELDLFIVLDQLYLSARHPGELGLLPHEKPTIKESEAFFSFCHSNFSSR
jgi:HEPN domain-containing protein